MKEDASKATLAVLEEARALLDTLTPLRNDCGRYCAHACCDGSDEEGMLLFPFEEWFYREPIAGFPFRLLPDHSMAENGKRLVCEGRCHRQQRPLRCRIFPLRMAVKQGGGCKAEIDPGAWAVCPLAERGGVRGLQPAFVSTVEQVGALFLQQSALREALYQEQAFIDEMRRL